MFVNVDLFPVCAGSGTARLEEHTRAHSHICTLHSHTLSLDSSHELSHSLTLSLTLSFDYSLSPLALTHWHSFSYTVCRLFSSMRWVWNSWIWKNIYTHIFVLLLPLLSSLFSYSCLFSLLILSHHSHSHSLATHTHVRLFSSMRWVWNSWIWKNIYAGSKPISM